MQNVLLDTSPIVAFIDADDANHAACTAFLKHFKGVFYSTEAILTESLHLLGDYFQNQKNCFQLFSRVVRLISADKESLDRSMELMEKYHDIPMDFADATLVTLAEDLQCPEIFTLDRRGFETYRWGHNKVFKIYPA